jgi:hypothetical protein
VVPAIFVVLALCAVESATRFFSKGGERWEGRVAAASGSFAVLVLLGALRESKVIPSSGSPLVDVLLAFVPFLAASVALLIGERIP